MLEEPSAWEAAAAAWLRETPNKAAADAMLEELSEEEAAESSTSEAHILIVDDADEDRLIMRTVLTSSGFTVSEADDGSTALPLICEVEDIDAILLDLRMKEMDGLETLRAIRESEENGALPIVILTGSQDPDEERQLLEAGADDYLRKPVDPLQLIARVRAVLRRARL